MVAGAIAGILAAVIVSVITLSARAVDDGSSAQSRGVRAAATLDQLTADAGVATAVTAQTGSSVTFVVPDRTGDAVAETIAYQYDAAAGTITRTLNGTASVIAKDVASFALAAVARAPVPLVVSATTTHLGHDDALLGTMLETEVRRDQAAAIYVRPTFAPGVSSWTIWRVRLMLRRSGTADTNIRVAIVEADANLRPTTTALAETVIAESTLGIATDWVEVSLGPTPQLAPGIGVCVLIECASASGSCAFLQYERDGTPMTARTHLTTKTGAADWTRANDRNDARFSVLGTTVSRPCN
ncbi:MAG TPA: hypothetical protein VD963_07580 [Phycisphaerales bacterium]|nr:hypothetical protein [Phycisphaerales bacterium]